MAINCCATLFGPSPAAPIEAQNRPPHLPPPIIQSFCDISAQYSSMGWDFWARLFASTIIHAWVEAVLLARLLPLLVIELQLNVGLLWILFLTQTRWKGVILGRSQEQVRGMGPGMAGRELEPWIAGRSSQNNPEIINTNALIDVLF